MLASFGVADERGGCACLRACREVGFQRSRPDQIAWQAASLRDVAIGETLRARAAGRDGSAGALEVFVHSPDRDGLFAAIVATLDRLGLAIQQARVLDGPHDMVFDSFEVVPVGSASDRRGGGRRAAACAGAGRFARQHHARRAGRSRGTCGISACAAQVGFDDIAARRIGGSAHRTMLSLVCTDRPGLLADVAQALREQTLRVHDARIATFGERAEDVFQITDQPTAQPLDDTQQQALREALLACLDGDQQ